MRSPLRRMRAAHIVPGAVVLTAAALLAMPAATARPPAFATTSFSLTPVPASARSASPVAAYADLTSAQRVTLLSIARDTSG